MQPGLGTTYVTVTTSWSHQLSSGPAAGVQGSPQVLLFFIRFCFSACYFVARGVCKALNQLLCPLGFRGQSLELRQCGISIRLRRNAGLQLKGAQSAQEL